MKKLIITIGLNLGVSLGVNCLYGQEYYFYVGGQKRILDVSDSKMFVKSDSVNQLTINKNHSILLFFAYLLLFYIFIIV